jgi:3-phytase
MSINRPGIVLASAAIALIAACAGPRPHPVDSSGDVRLVERWTTTPTPVDNIDSVATWHAGDGVAWLFASAKDVDDIVVFDANSGANLQRIGGSGTVPGRFERPNGIAVIDDLLFVVERDNHRVQVLSLPELKSVAVFGATELKVPYGLWIEPKGSGAYDVYVTDSYQLADGTPPPLEQLSERVKHYRVVQQGGKIETRFLASFGDTSASGALRWVESIYGDPAHGALADRGGIPGKRQHPARLRYGGQVPGHRSGPQPFRRPGRGHCAVELPGRQRLLVGDRPARRRQPLSGV